MARTLRRLLTVAALGGMLAGCGAYPAYQPYSAYGDGHGAYPNYSYDYSGSYVAIGGGWRH